MKSNVIKIGIALSVFTLLFTSNVNAQSEKKTYYYFVSSTAYTDGEKRAIVTEVRRAICEDKTSYTFRLGVENQFHTYQRANYKNWHDYEHQGWLFDSKAKAEKVRMDLIADYRDSYYGVTKDMSYKYYCD